MNGEPVEVVDLDALTTDDLLRERDQVTVEISRIATALQTQPGRPTTREDESPAWVAYRDWRKRARLALDYKRREMVEIKAALRSRQDTAAAGARLRRAEGVAPPPSVVMGEERYARIKAVLDADTPETRLLWAWRIVRHLIGDATNTLPASLDEADRDHLTAIGTYLRRTYGGNLKRFYDSPDGGLS